jgi:hypothetical protein
MDSVATSLITAMSSGLTTTIVKDAYKAVKQAIKKKLGISETIEAFEANPNSQKNKIGYPKSWPPRMLRQIKK